MLLTYDLKEWRQSHTKDLTLSNEPWKGLTFSLPFPLLMPTWSLLIGPAQFLPHSSQLAISFRLTLLPHCIYIVPRNPSSSLQPWRSRQHTFLKHWLLPTSRYGP
jgi:hypothetical protein